VKTEDVNGNEDDVGAKRENENEQQDAVGNRLASLQRASATLVDEVLAQGEDRDRGREQVYAEEYPGAAPVECASCGKKQKAKESGVEKDSEDLLEAEHGLGNIP
jgi:hypothetical protein